MGGSSPTPRKTQPRVEESSTPDAPNYAHRKPRREDFCPRSGHGCVAGAATRRAAQASRAEGEPLPSTPLPRASGKGSGPGPRG